MVFSRAVGLVKLPSLTSALSSSHALSPSSPGVDCPRNSTDIFNVTKVPCFGGYSRVLTKAKEERKKKKSESRRVRSRGMEGRTTRAHNPLFSRRFVRRFP